MILVALLILSLLLSQANRSIYQLPSTTRFLTQSHSYYAQTPIKQRIQLSEEGIRFILPVNDTDLFNRGLHPRSELRPFVLLPSSVSIRLRVRFLTVLNADFFQVMQTGGPILQLEMADKLFRVRHKEADGHLHRYPLFSLPLNQDHLFRIVFQKGFFQLFYDDQSVYSKNLSSLIKSRQWIQYGIYATQTPRHVQSLVYSHLQVEMN